MFFKKNPKASSYTVRFKVSDVYVHGTCDTNTFIRLSAAAPEDVNIISNVKFT